MSASSKLIAPVGFNRLSLLRTSKEREVMISDLYYDRDGKLLSGEVWGRYLADVDQKRVALSYVGNKRISTVWLGIDMAFHGGSPIIFETMVFSDDEDIDFQQRYATEEQALLGHLDVLRRLKFGKSFGLTLHEVDKTYEELRMVEEKAEAWGNKFDIIYSLKDGESLMGEEEEI